MLSHTHTQTVNKTSAVMSTKNVFAEHSREIQLELSHPSKRCRVDGDFHLKVTFEFRPHECVFERHQREDDLRGPGSRPSLKPKQLWFHLCFCTACADISSKLCYIKQVGVCAPFPKGFLNHPAEAAGAMWPPYSPLTNAKYFAPNWGAIYLRR